MRKGEVKSGGVKIIRALYGRFYMVNYSDVVSVIRLIKNRVLIRAIYSPTDMVISLNELLSRRIQEVDSFPILIPPLFTSPLRTYLA